MIRLLNKRYGKQIILFICILFISTNLLPNIQGKISLKSSDFNELINYSKNTINTDTYDYVIITSEHLEKSIIYFQNWKEYINYNVKIVNISWIYNNYNGSDEQESIRYFLQDKYYSWGIKYLLIIGSNDLIPMRYCLYNDTNNQAILTDYYYADLTGDWDSDNDGIYAEFIEDDEPDFLAEILVGRIPFDSPSIVENILKKTIDFERDNGEWKNKVLLLAGIMNYENEVGLGNPKTDGAVLLEKLWNDVYLPNGFSKTTMYEKDGLSPSTYDADYPLNLDNVVNYWSEGYGLVNWVSHGNPQDIYRKIWDHDRNLNNVPDLNEVISQSFLSSNDTIFLNNNKPSIVFSCSCSNSKPEDSNNLGNKLLLNGAVAFIGATQLSYYYYGWDHEEDGGSMAIDYFFFKYLIEQKNSCSEALYNSLFYCWNDDDISSVYENMFLFNLYGDPSISLEVYNSTNPPDTPNRPYGQEIIDSSTEYIFSTYSSHPDDQNIYYLWDWNDGSEYELIGPYESDNIIELGHKWKIPGRYRIRVKALSIYGDESSWSEPLLIKVQGPIIDIENINGGIKINAEIQNTGDKDAENVNWNMTIYGGSILLGKITSGIITSIPAGGSSIIVSNLIIGLAFPAIIIIEAGIKDSTSDRELQSANIILFNIRIK